MTGDKSRDKSLINDVLIKRVSASEKKGSHSIKKIYTPTVGETCKQGDQDTNLI